VGDSATREIYRFDDAGQPVPLTQGAVGIPRAIVVRPDGSLLVADQELHYIWQVPASGGKPEKFVAVPGLIAMCADKEGVLWVTCGPKHDLCRISPDGTVENVITDGPIQNGQELVVDDARTVYIADNYGQAIWKVPLGQPPEQLVTGAPLVSPAGITHGPGGFIVTDPHAQAVFHLDGSGQVTKLMPAR
jgi:sugar lactone lactonase YvrE